MNDYETKMAQIKIDLAQVTIEKGLERMRAIRNEEIDIIQKIANSLMDCAIIGVPIPDPDSIYYHAAANEKSTNIQGWYEELEKRFGNKGEGGNE